ncbi:MAG: segregation/condensation protein A [Synergistaceae bacterium]|nr:segregation/condensation protein A [Synergistaceae bacterium]
MKFTLQWVSFTEVELTQNDNLLETTTIEDIKSFEVQLGAFSGPLDLLCHLVESREMDPSKLNLTDLVAQYVNFMLNSKRTTLNEMAEFFAFASRLLLRKVRSLFPARSVKEDSETIVYDDDYEETEEELQRLLEGFLPYRKATSLLSSYQEKREQFFTRVFDEDVAPFYDLGDLYGLATQWWQLLDEYNQRKRDADADQDELWSDIPDAMPEEGQVEERMDELLAKIKVQRLYLSEILHEKNKKMLIVTLLALLEMSRLGMVKLVQQKTWGDVEIAAA